MIYIVAVHQFVKIGYTTDLDQRLKEIQACSPYDLELIRTISPGYLWQEQWLHRQFASDRVRNEWFKYSKEMLYIQLPSTNPENIIPRPRRINRLEAERKKDWDKYWEVLDNLGMYG